MNKHVIKRIIIAAAFIACIAFSCSYLESQRGLLLADVYYILTADDKNPDPSPNLLSNYPDNKTGYYQFDPKTILASLGQDKDVFTSISFEDLNTDTDAYNLNIEWTQSDFLRVADALSKQAWHEPLDLNDWSVYSIWFDGLCNGNFRGFRIFEIVYYKTIKTGWESGYTARYIQVRPNSGKAIWAGAEKFSADFFLSWTNIELTKFQTTAEQVVRSAEQYKKRTSDLSNNGCRVGINFYNRYKYDWEVYYYSPISLYVFIDPFTGKVH
jgi:hypothetical protein